MAKRRKKKLNKRVVVLLGSIGLLVVLLLTMVVVTKWDSISERFFPRDPKALMSEAREYAKKGNRKEAHKAFGKALNAGGRIKSPELPKYYMEVAEFEEKWAEDGKGLTETQRREMYFGSLSRARKALLLDEKYIPAQEFIVRREWVRNIRLQALLDRDTGPLGGDRNKVKPEWPGFIKEADALLKLNPKDANTVFRRAQAKSLLVNQEMPGDYARGALEDYRKAIELAPRKVEFRLQLIRLLKQIPMLAEQVKIEDVYREAIAANPDSAELLVNYAMYLRDNDRDEQTRQMLAQAVQRDPVQGNIALAEYYARAKDLPKAIASLDLAIEADPLDTRPYLGKVTLYSARRMHNEALAVTQQAIEALTHAPEADAEAASRREASVAQMAFLKASTLLDMVEDPNYTKNEEQTKSKLIAQIKEVYPTLQGHGLSESALARVSGRLAMAEGRTEDALVDLEKVYSNSKMFDLKVANHLINIYIRKRLPGKAQDVVERLLSIPSQQDNPQAWKLMARFYMQYRDYERATVAVRKVLAADPNDPEAINLSTALDLATGKGTMEIPAGIHPDARTAGLLLEQATKMWLDGRRDDAIGWVEKLRKAAPDNKRVFSRLFQYYRAAQRVDAAEKLVNAELEKHPDDKKLMARKLLLRETDPNAQYQILMGLAEEYESPQKELEKAAIAAGFGRKKEYVEFLEAAAVADPNSVSVIERQLAFAIANNDWELAEKCVQRAEKGDIDGCGGKLYQIRYQTARGRHDAVIDLATEVLREQPNRKDARCLLGQAYLRKKLFDQAYEEFKIVYDNDPGYPAALVGLAAATSTTGLNRQLEHQGYVTAAYRIIPNDRYIRERMMEIEQERSSPEELIVKRERALAQSPDDLRNIAGLGSLYERVGRYDDAENMFVSYREKTDNKLLGAALLCRFYLRRENIAKIEEVMEPMLTDQTDPVGVRVLYAEMFTRSDPKKAEQYLQNAIDANPKDPRGHLALARFWANLPSAAGQDDRMKWKNAVDAMEDYLRVRPTDLGGAKELIRYCIEAREFQSAAKRIEDLLKADPKDAATVTLAGLLSMKQEKYEEAMGHFSRAIELNPGFGEPLIHRAELYRVRGDYARAKSDLQEAKRLTNRVDVSMRLGLIFERLREDDSAELVYREVRHARPEYGPAIDRLAAIYLRRSKWNDMERMLESVQKAMPDNPRFYELEARMFEARENTPGSLAAWKKAVDKAPSEPSYLMSYLSALAKAKRHDTVLKVTEPYMRSEFAAQVSPLRATALVRLGRPEDAEQLFLNSLASASTQLVLLHAQQMETAYGRQAAIEKVRKWIDGGLKGWQALLEIGVMHLQAKDFDKAAEALIEARKQMPTPYGKAMASRYIGSAYYQLGRYEDCKQAYLAALAQRPRDYDVMNNLAYLLTTNLNDPKAALPYAQDAAAGRRSDAKVLDTLGWTLAKLGRLGEAETVLLRAIQLESPLAVSRYHLGWVYEQRNKLDDARKQYLQGQEMLKSNPADPEYIDVTRALERVRQKLQRGS